MYLRLSNWLSQILIRRCHLPLAAHSREWRNLAARRRICLILALLLAMLIGLRAGHLKSALEMVFISPAIAHEHGHGNGGGGGGPAQKGGDKYSNGNGGSGGGNGYTGHGGGSAPGHNGLGGGDATPHGDGKLSPAGMPHLEVAGLPSDHELHGAKDDKPWEKLLNEHLGAHFTAGGAGDHLEHKESHEGDHRPLNDHLGAHYGAGDSGDHLGHKECHESDHEHKYPHEGHNEYHGHRESDRDDRPFIDAFVPAVGFTPRGVDFLVQIGRDMEAEDLFGAFMIGDAFADRFLSA